MALQCPNGTHGVLATTHPTGHVFVPNSRVTKYGSPPFGMRCRYHSQPIDFLNCKVLSSNETDSSYNLDAKGHASPDKIASLGNASSDACIWPAGSLVVARPVEYHKSSVGATLPAQVLPFSHTDKVYNPNVRAPAHVDRIGVRPAQVPIKAVATPRNASQATPTLRNMTAGSGYQVLQSGPSMPKSAVALVGCSSAAGTRGSPPSTSTVTREYKVLQNGTSMTTAPSGVSFAIDSGRVVLRPIVHPGPPCKHSDELVAVIVTISSGSSYDRFFSVVPQIAGEGKRVATYEASTSSLPLIAAVLSGRALQGNLTADFHRNLKRLTCDMQSVQPESVLFNWESCAGYACEHFPNASVVMDLVKILIDGGHMVMFSNFSLKALIQEWREDLLGPNPFVKVGEFQSSCQLNFDPILLRACPSAQLQKLGELASDGHAALHAMGGTIAFSVDWSKADCSAYSCEALTVMSKLDGMLARPVPGQGCEVRGQRGFAGHVLLTFSSGGRLLASAGDWVELSRFDITKEKTLQDASVYGVASENRVQASLSSRPEGIRFLGIQDLLDIFDDFRAHAGFVRLALKSGSYLPDATGSIVEMVLAANAKADEAATNEYVRENLETAKSLLVRSTETALDHMVTKIDSWQFDKTGRVDAAPGLDKSLQAIQVSQDEMAVVQQMAFCLRPPSLHNYETILGISDRLFVDRLGGHENPVAIVTVGAPGSGKDYMLMSSPNCCLDYLMNEHGYAKDQYVALDPDVWITQLCENVNEHRDLANFLNLEHFFYTINRRSNLIFNATGKDIKNTAGRVISRLREANYRVYICVVLAKFPVVMQRIADRKRKTGRDVPEAVVKSIFKGLQEAVPLYMKNQAKMADAVLVYCNNGDGTDSRSGPSFTLTSGVDPTEAIDFASATLVVPS